MFLLLLLHIQPVQELPLRVEQVQKSFVVGRMRHGDGYAICSENNDSKAKKRSWSMLQMMMGYLLPLLLFDCVAREVRSSLVTTRQPSQSCLVVKMTELTFSYLTESMK